MLKILLSVIIFSFPWASHPFYLSVCDLKYNGDEKALQGTVKIFTSDLEDAVAKTTDKRPDLVNARDDEATRDLLQSYLKAHLGIQVNDSPLKITVIGCEREEEATWVYVELNDCPRPKKITILNKILCEHLPQQMNIVHLQVDSSKRTQKASCEDPHLAFDF